MLEDVLNKLPHQPPMRLLDEIVTADTKHIHALVHHAGTSVFTGPQGIPSIVAMEYIAQAAAAYFAFHAGGDAPQRPGMLVACRSLTARARYLATDAPLHVIARPANANVATQTPTLVRFEGSVGFSPDDVEVSATLSVYL